MPGFVGGCYIFGYSPLTRDEAIKACNARHADLIAIRGPDDENIIMKANDFFKPHNFLIGAFKVAGRSVNGVAPNTWMWVDGSPFNYTNWENESYANIEGDAVALLNHRSRNAVWTSVPMNANDRFPYVCRVREGYIDQRPNCYEAFTGLTADDCYLGPADNDTYANAEATCERFNGALSVIHDGRTNELIHGIVAGMGFPRFLIGASNNNIEFVWRWVDFSPVDYQNWAPSEPMKTRPEDPPLCATIDSDSGLWFTVNCSYAGAFILCRVRH